MKSKSDRTRFTIYRRGAQQRNLEFSLEFEEFQKLIHSKCQYCGDRFGQILGVDRVDNTRGYFIENCVPCCSLCNRMKLNLTLEEFLLQCRKITAKYFGDRHIAE